MGAEVPVPYAPLSTVIKNIPNNLELSEILLIFALE